MQKTYTSTGEEEFINGVVKAILINDTSKLHILVNNNGFIKYITYPNNHHFDDIVDNYGRPVKMLCVVSEKLITDFHYKAGNDDLSKGWAKRAVKSVIDHGKEVSKSYYENDYKEFRKNVKSQRIVVPEED
ncbi:hypothetical protein [Metabacillus rhizolycopersici]|uniref:DUF2255 family protein n=1 Tax=Metabacillus rhizolycopersici TaxID=2875709 RepID=A0ABS7UWM0_9BACI|nr:hypothetical protein [Metabacillus rhizolycopersici]MBZ5752442.1 hypothetical protein [Metabacillus rhizolycopersici]